MTDHTRLRPSARAALALLAIGLVAPTASGDEPAEMNYAFATPRIWKSSAKDLDLPTSTSAAWPQPKAMRTSSTFSRLLGAAESEAPALGKPAGRLPWEQLRKSGPNPRWRPLAPIEEARPEPLTDVALRFTDEGAAGRMYR